MSKVQLNPSCILNVPLHNYSNDFSFIVNGEEFRTSVLASELLSPKICQIHSVDPTVDTFVINTEYRGDFSRILNLLNFQKAEIQDHEVNFFSEVIEKLENESIKTSDTDDEEEMSIENVVYLIKKHERFNHYNVSRLSREIEFASSHFYEICEDKKDELKSLQKETLFDILNNERLRIDTEDQLIEFINELYSNDRNLANYYEAVKFENVSSEKIREFIEIYNEEDMNKTVWCSICQRLEKEVKANKCKHSQRYEVKSEQKEEEGTIFSPNNNNKNDFCGIIHHLRTKSNNIENEINITASSCGDSREKYQPKTVILYENKNNYFYSKDMPNSWLCIDFKEHRVIPTDYTIRSLHYGPNNIQPRSWIVEGSIDNETWFILDEQKNCSALNGDSLCHTFHIKMQKSTTNRCRYIRIQETDTNWRNDNYLCINAIEIYGKLL